MFEDKYYKKAIASSVWQILDKFLAMGVNFVVSIALARYLMPEQYGVLSFLLALLALFIPIAQLGLNGLLIKEFGQESANKVLSNAIALRLLAGLIAFCIVAFWFAISLPNESASKLLLPSVVLSFSLVLNSFFAIEQYLLKELKGRLIAKLKTITTLLSSLVKVMLIFFQASLEFVVIAFLLDTLILALLFVISISRQKLELSIRYVNYNYIKQLLSKSKWLIGSGIAAVIYLKIDQIMLAQMVGTTEVGYYAVAAKLSEVWAFLPAIVITSFFPALLSNKKSNIQQYETQLAYLNNRLFIFGVIISVIVFFTAPLIVTALFGEAYTHSVIILQIHIWGLSFVFMRTLLSKWLIVEDLYKFSLVTQGGGAVINVLLNAFLIPSFGGAGAAFATLVSYVFASYIMLFFSSKTRPMAHIISASLLLPFSSFLHLFKSRKQ